jgi:hypothetical protein
MSTLNEREAILRRALRAAADGVEPGSDGLERIQSRLGRPRPVPVAWIEAIWTDWWLRAPVGLRSAFGRVPGLLALAWTRFGPRPGRSGSPLSRTLGWLRPAAVLGVTVFIVAAGAYVAISAQQAVNPTSSNQRPPLGAGASGQPGSNSGRTTSHGHHRLVTNSASPSPSGSCKTRKKAGSSPSTGISQIQPTTTPSTTPTSSGSASPSTTDSASGNPSSTAPTTSSTTAPVVPATTSSAGPLTTAGVTTTAANVTATTQPGSSQCGKRTTTRQPSTISGAAAQQPTANGQGAVVTAGRLNDNG